jgi:ATP-dependent DNA helicase RecQ
MLRGPRKPTETYAKALTERGLRTEAYHAGRKQDERDRVHEQFLDDELDVVVAAAAFGMGIDKPNVRFVINADIPDPWTVLPGDRPLRARKFFGTHTPDEESLLAVLVVLRAADGPLPQKALAEETGLSARRLTELLNQLQETRAVKSGRRGVRLEAGAKLPTVVERAVELAEARQRVDRSRIEMMRGYAETDACRRQFLLGYFGEDPSRAVRQLRHLRGRLRLRRGLRRRRCSRRGRGTFPAPGLCCS